MLWVDNRSTDDPYLNLALEEYLVRNKKLSAPLLLLYVNKSSIVLGKNQNIWKEANIEYAHKHNILLCRRLSGGGTVYHDKGNINYSIISPFADKLLHNFTEITKPVLDILSENGIEANLNEHNDIIYKGFKLSGTAQFTNRKNILSHGTLLVNSDLKHLRNSLLPQFESVKTRAIDSKRSSVENLSFWREFSVPQLCNLLRDSYCAKDDFHLSTEDWEAVSILRESKFKTRKWVIEKSPKCTIELTSKIGQEEYQISLSIEDGKIKEYSIKSKDQEIETGIGISIGINEIKKLESLDSELFQRIWKEIREMIV